MLISSLWTSLITGKYHDFRTHFHSSNQTTKIHNKGSAWMHAAGRKFCECWEERLTQLTSALYVSFCWNKKTKQKKRNCKIFWNKITQSGVQWAQGARFVSWKVLLRSCRIWAYWSDRNSIPSCHHSSALPLYSPTWKHVASSRTTVRKEELGSSYLGLFEMWHSSKIGDVFALCE